MNYISNSKSYVRLEAVNRNTFVLIVKIRRDTYQCEVFPWLFQIMISCFADPEDMLKYYRFSTKVASGQRILQGHIHQELGFLTDPSTSFYLTKLTSWEIYFMSLLSFLLLDGL